MYRLQHVFCHHGFHGHCHRFARLGDSDLGHIRSPDAETAEDRDHRNPLTLWNVSSGLSGWPRALVPLSNVDVFFCCRATAIGIWRLVILIQLFYGKPSADPTYAISFCVSSIEVNVAVISACGPSMKSLTKRYLPRLLGSSRRGTSGPT